MNAKIKLITLAIIIGIIVLVFPNFVNAKTVTISDNTKVYTYAPAGLESQWRYYTIGELINGGLATTSATHVFKNEFLFCYEPGQDLNGTNYYLVMEKYKLENNKITKYTRTKKNTSFSSAGSRTSSDCINFAKGLAYIMSFYNDSSYSHDRLGDSRSYNNFGPTCDDINLALWGYLDGFYKSSDTTVKNFFGIPKQDVSIDNTAKKISKSTAYYGKNGYKWVKGSSTKAYNLYKNALNVYKGTLEYDITAEFYKFRELYDPGSQQDLMFLKTITYEPPPVIPEIKLNFYKVDYNTTSTGLSGAELKLEKASNVDSISKTTIQSSGSNGKFDTITIKPTKTNPGTVKIKVTETKAPSGYDKLSDTIELTIKYDKTTGKVTKITESSDYIDTSISSGVGVIKFKNKPLIKLRLYKRDYADVSKKVNGAKIKIERESNVANINGSTSAVTLTSSGDYGFFDQITLEPTDRSKQMKIKITETTVPTNYVGPSATILTIKYNSNTGKVTSITPNENSEYFKFETPTSGNHNGKGLIYIKNKFRKITNLTILKTDMTGGNKLSGAKFTLYLNNIKSVKIGSTTFTLSSMTENQKYTASSGITLMRHDTDRVSIYGLTTNSSGEIKIPEIIATKSDEILVTITETQAADGYEELPDQLNLILKYNGEWKLYERKGEGGITNELDSKYWTLNTGNNLKVQLKNEKEPEIPKIKLDFYKVDYDDSSKGLEGAKLKIEKASNSNIDSISKTTITSGADGGFGRITITPTASNPGTVKIKVTETQAPDGYDKISDSIELTITYDKTTGKVTKITESSDYVNTSLSSGVGIVYVKNKIRKITDLTILKTDIDGKNKLQGAKFTLYLNNIKSVKIGSKVFELADMTEKQVYTASSGITLKRHDTDRVSIYGLTTNSNGEIKIPEIIATSSDTIYVEITEGKAPDGYEELPDSLKLVLKKDGEWKLFERKGEGGLTNELDSKYWTLNTGNNLKVQLKNEKQPEEPEIPKIKLDFYKVDYDDTSKRLEGAKLKIEKASNSNIDSISKTTITSGADGGFGKITITPTESNPGTVKIKVTETQAPDGYDKISGSIELTIKYNTETGEVTEITESSDYIDTSKNEGVGIVYVKNKKEPEIPKIKLDFYKVDYDDTSKRLEGAKLKIEKASNSNIDSISKTTITSGADGKFDEITITPTESNPGTVKIKVTETQEPDGYDKISGSIELTIKYNTETGEVTGITESSDYINITENEGVGVVYVKNKENLKIHIAGYKKDEQTKVALQGAKFKATFTQDSKVFAEKTVTSDVNGYVDFTEVKPLSKNKITVNIKEIEAPSGWLANYNKTIEFTYDETNRTWKKEKDDGNIINNTATTSGVYLVNLEDIENSSQIEKLQILKTDEKTSNALNGVNFKIELENIKSVNGSGYNNPIETTTDSNGKLELNNLIIKDVNKNIKITITETQAPVGYKKIEGPITIELKRTGNTLEVIGGNATTSTKEVSLDNEKIAQHQVFLNIKNIPIMNIGGIVWRDGQTGVKEVQDLNGKYGDSGDQALSGIAVFLVEGEPAFNSEGNITNTIVASTTSANGGEVVSYIGHAGTKTYTLQKGEYLFTGIENKDNYYVVFKYDGITYKTVEKGSENNSSKAEEIGRDNFNNKYKTITKDGAESVSGGKTSLEYQELDKASKLITKENDGSIKQKFVMYAKSEKVDTKNWQNTWTEEGSVNKDDSRLNINCGLLEKVFDLAIGTDVKSAKLTINGKETTYNYAQIMNGTLVDKSLDEILQNKSSEDAKPVYNLYLYSSDYKYRIEDYKTDIEGLPTGVTGESELEAYVTYSVILKNQTKHTALVDKFVYYYNSQVYTPTFAKGDLVDGYEVENIEGNKITFKSVDSEGNKLEDEGDEKKDFRKEINITFKVNKTGRDIILKGDVRNVAEITKYSTIEGGLIDRDSQPGNADVTIENENPTIDEDEYEDDTDEAKGINISIRDDRKREISGTVFEDIKTDDRNIDGINNDGTAVNDVIVQLIEIKNIGGTYYEYIWQETRSGNSTVKTTAKNGYSGAPYDNGITSGSGQYKFTDFIPGNYIIRFIYGDGRTWDVTSSVEKYNGQAYQSTVDTKYKNTWYNTSGYGSDESTATDNEARRLETMIYTVEIDGFVGAAIKSISTGFDQLTPEDKNLISQYYDKLLIEDRAVLEKACKIFDSSKQLADIDEDSEKYGVIKQYALQKTWMSAETSKINIPVDAANIATDSNSTTATMADIVNLNTINFGLRLRPQTKLTVEKHITALKIVPTGVGVQAIVDAKADIGQILDAAKNDAPVDVSRYKNRSCNNSIKENKQRILESRNRYRRTCTRS